MNFVHMLVFFISITTDPADPGPGKYGSMVEWVVYGAPSAEKAHVWAQTQYDKMHAKDSVPQKIKEFLVLPISDTLYTDTGLETVQWTSLPGIEDFDRGVHEEELHSTAVIRPPNEVSGKGIKASGKDMTLEELRASIDKQGAGQMQLNWDKSKSWYYILYTSHQASLVKSVNSVAAVIPYVKAVRGTPLGDESVRITPWQGLTRYDE